MNLPREFGRIEIMCWPLLVHVVLAVLRPVALLLDLVEPPLRRLGLRADFSDRRTCP